MATVLAERDGWIYAKEPTTDYFEPRSIIHWWPTGMRWYQFMQWFADEERARAALGEALHPISKTGYLDERGWTYHLPNGGSTTPDFTETVPIPEPKQRGRKAPVRWYQGSWQKQTARGWVAA